MSRLLSKVRSHLRRVTPLKRVMRSNKLSLAAARLLTTLSKSLRKSRLWSLLLQPLPGTPQQSDKSSEAQLRSSTHAQHTACRYGVLVMTSRQPPVKLAAAVAQLPSEGDDLADDQLRHTTRIAEGRIEHRDAHCVRRLHRHSHVCGRTHKCCIAGPMIADREAQLLSDRALPCCSAECCELGLLLHWLFLGCPGTRDTGLLNSCPVCRRSQAHQYCPTPRSWIQKVVAHYRRCPPAVHGRQARVKPFSPHYCQSSRLATRDSSSPLDPPGWCQCRSSPRQGASWRAAEHRPSAASCSGCRARARPLFSLPAPQASVHLAGSPAHGLFFGASLSDLLWQLFQQSDDLAECEVEQGGTLSSREMSAALCHTACRKRISPAKAKGETVSPSMVTSVAPVSTHPVVPDKQVLSLVQH